MSFRSRFDNSVETARFKLGPVRFNMLVILLLVGLSMGALRLLDGSEYGTTALVYITVPYLVAVLITLFRPYAQSHTWGRAYLSHLATSTVVFFATSVLLGEGFICVLFFMPIYFLIALIVFAGFWKDPDPRPGSGGRSRTYSIALPVLVAAFSLEGTSDSLSFDRRNTATATVTTSVSPESVFANLALPIRIERSSDWMLGVFPMPIDVEAGSLNKGDVHRIHTRYHRWFVTNTHDGEIQLRIDRVTPDGVSATFVKDTSYFSTYVDLVGSETRITVGDDGLTRVTLTIEYRRRLDPAWYFGPMQQYAMTTMAEHLIREVMIRE